MGDLGSRGLGDSVATMGAPDLVLNLASRVDGGFFGDRGYQPA
jgi:hypothetical protein